MADPQNPLLDVAEMSFCIVKPHAVVGGFDGEIRTLLERNRFTILGHRRLFLTPDIIKQIFINQNFDEHHIRSFQGAATYFHVSRPNAIAVLRKLSGHLDPGSAAVGSFRYMYGVGPFFNAVFVPASEDEFRDIFKKLELWFQVYVQALTQRESEPLTWAAEKFKEMFGGSSALGAEGGEAERSGEKAPTTEHKPEEEAREKITPITDRVVRSYDSEGE